MTKYYEVEASFEDENFLFKFEEEEYDDKMQQWVFDRIAEAVGHHLLEPGDTYTVKIKVIDDDFTGERSL